MLKFFSLRALVMIVILVAAASAFGATIVSSTANVTGLPMITVTSAGPSGSTVAVSADTTGTGATKKAMVHKFTIAGNEVDVLIRIQPTPHGLYIDLVADATITSLSTSTGSMSLTTASHPSATKDATDTAALVAAGGS